MQQVLRPRGGSVNHQSSHLNHVRMCLSMQDGCVGRGCSHAAATRNQTRRFRFVALNVCSGKDICGADFSASVTKPQPCEKKKEKFEGRDAVTPDPRPGLALCQSPIALVKTTAAVNNANTPYIEVTSYSDIL